MKASITVYAVSDREPVHKEYIWILSRGRFLKREVYYPSMDKSDVYQEGYYELQHDLGYVARDFVKGDFTNYLLDSEVEGSLIPKKVRY